jgi:hypothetical protein
MSDEQFKALRNDIAFYACLICSVVVNLGEHKWFAWVWLGLALIIQVFGKIRYKRSTAAGEQTKEGK